MRNSLDPGSSARPRLSAAACAVAASAIALLLAAYGGTLDYPFVFDDLDAIVHNATVRGVSLLAAWSPPPDTPVSGRPIVNLSFALNARWAGPSLDPSGFRAVNLGLHALNALLVFAIVRRLLERPAVPERLRRRASFAAAWIALVWALHPLQSEAVVYVTQRTELMMSSFALGAVLLSLGYLADPDTPNARRTLLLAACSSVLSSGCKETAIVIPLAVLALDWSFYAGSFTRALARHRPLYLALSLAVAPLVLQLITQPRDRTAGFGLGVSPWEALALSGHAIAWYLRLCFWPDPLSVTYSWSYAEGFARFGPSMLLVTALGLVTVYLFWTRRWPAAAGGWFFAWLGPTSSVVPILSEVAAERRMYLPLLAVVAVVVGAACMLWPRSRTVSAAICASLVAVCALRTHARAGDYASAESLFRAALRAAPDNPQAMWGLASALEARGDDAGALALYERMAAERYPYSGPASWGTRGLFAAAKLYERRGDRARARQSVQRALEHDPTSAIGRLHRAAALVAAGRDDRAIAELERMLDEQPFLHERVHRELAALYARRGDAARARAHRDAADRE